MSGGIKHDGEKPRMDLISPIAIFALARVLTFGAKKYAARNWENGFTWCRPIAAILRHTFAYLMGETHDPETGESHMAHVMCEAMFLTHFEKTHPELDDRPNTPKWVEMAPGTLVRDDSAKGEH
jgi:hypothetical protein